MFDVSFSELVLILIVGLVVFGPEKLPEVVRTVGLWLSKLRRSFNHIRSEIEREVGMDELKRDIHNQGIMDSLKEVHNDLRKTQQELSQIPRDVQSSINRSVESSSGLANGQANSDTANADTAHNPNGSSVAMEPFPVETAPTTSAAQSSAPTAPATAAAEPERYHRPS